MFAKLWSRAKSLLSRLLRRKPPEPGRFEEGAKSSFRGGLVGAPWIWPRRKYLVYVPRGHTNWRRVPLLALIHGCRQTPEEIAAATRVTALADDLGCLVLLPRQNPHANAWGCWNWFDPATAHGWGEAAIVAAQIRAVRRKYRIDRKRVYLAGLSSGGGLVSAIALRRPDLIAGAFVHSGVPCGAASSALDAFAVLKRGAESDLAQIARDVRARVEPRTLPVPLLVLHGGEDSVVAPVNAAQLVRQFLALNGHPAASAGSPEALPPPDGSTAASTADGRVVTTSEWRVADRLVARHVLVDGLGHAWSGGDAAYPYNDPHAPDATDLLRAFVHDTLQ
jgi:poly(hydroxyalkanoate) depolymerase family esterase